MSAYQLDRPSTAFGVLRQRRPRITSATHLAWIRTLPSIVPGSGAVEAAHIRFGDPRYAKPHVGLGEKPDDKWTVPLAADQHRDQHSTNERLWWLEKGIDPVIMAALLWAHTGDTEAARHLISRAKLLVVRDA